MTTIIYFSDHQLLATEADFTNDRFPSYIFFFAYGFCRLLNFGKKYNMIFQDFPSTQSGHKITAKEVRALRGYFGPL